MYTLLPAHLMHDWWGQNPIWLVTLLQKIYCPKNLYLQDHKIATQSALSHSFKYWGLSDIKGKKLRMSKLVFDLLSSTVHACLALPLGEEKLWTTFWHARLMEKAVQGHRPSLQGLHWFFPIHTYSFFIQMPPMKTKLVVSSHSHGSTKSQRSRILTQKCTEKSLSQTL